jgi:hypothetical protein
MHPPPMSPDTSTLWGLNPIWLGYLAAAVILGAWRAWREK